MIPDPQPNIPLVEWDDKYTVHVVTLDDHHKKLFDLLNELFWSIGEEKEADYMLKTLDELKKYTSYHFYAEEKYMEENQYPGLTRHKQHHQDFVTKLQEFEDEIAQDKYHVSKEIIVFLKNWLVAHIQTIDKQYDEYIEEHKPSKPKSLIQKALSFLNLR